MNTNSNLLPKDLAVVETCDGTWFPAFASSIESPSWIGLVGNSTIPAALKPREDPRRGYASRQEAIDAYEAWHEAAILPVCWQALAAATEIYPERNAWYGEEISRVLGDRDMTTITSLGCEALALVMAEHEGCGCVLSATGATPDEAMEALYQRVYAFTFGEEDIALLCVS